MSTLVRIIQEADKRDTSSVDNQLKKISHWATSIDRIFTNSKEFRNVLYDFINRGDKAENAAVEKLKELETTIHKVYKELENMEETMLEE